MVHSSQNPTTHTDYQGSTTQHIRCKLEVLVFANVMGSIIVGVPLVGVPLMGVLLVDVLLVGVLLVNVPPVGVSVVGMPLICKRLKGVNDIHSVLQWGNPSDITCFGEGLFAHISLYKA